MSKTYFGNGYLDGSGSSAFGARADHTHADGVKAVKKTIKVADWSSKAAEVPFEEGTYIGYQVDAASLSVANTAVLAFTSVGTKKLNFGCTNTPAANIDIYILYL